jgi:hypothetical protein
MGLSLIKEDEVLDYKIKFFLSEFNKQESDKLMLRKDILEMIGRYKEDIKTYDQIYELQAEIVKNYNKMYELQKDLGMPERIAMQCCNVVDQRIVLNQKILNYKKNIPIKIDHNNSYLLIDVFRKISIIRYSDLLPEIIDYIISIYREIVLNRIISIDFEVMKNIINIIRFLSP